MISQPVANSIQSFSSLPDAEFLYGNWLYKSGIIGHIDGSYDFDARLFGPSHWLTHLSKKRWVKERDLDEVAYLMKFIYPESAIANAFKCVNIEARP